MASRKGSGRGNAANNKLRAGLALIALVCIVLIGLYRSFDLKVPDTTNKPASNAHTFKRKQPAVRSAAATQAATAAIPAPAHTKAAGTAAGADSTVADMRVGGATAILDFMAPIPVQGQFPTHTYKVLKTMKHDKDAFTQGLEFANGTFYESTGMATSLRQYDVETGKMILRIDLDAQQYFGEGITVVGDNIVFLTWRSHVGFIFNRETFAEVGRFSYDTEGWGICNDFATNKLYMTDGTHFLYKRNPKTLALEGKVPVINSAGQPIVRLNELECIRGEVWANVWYQDVIVRINPTTGAVLGMIDMAGIRKSVHPGEDCLNGIAWDPATDRLWVTGKLWHHLYEIEIVEDTTVAAFV